MIRFLWMFNLQLGFLVIASTLVDIRWRLLKKNTSSSYDFLSRNMKLFFFSFPILPVLTLTSHFLRPFQLLKFKYQISSFLKKGSSFTSTFKIGFQLTIFFPNRLPTSKFFQNRVPTSNFFQNRLLTSNFFKIEKKLLEWGFSLKFS